MVSFASGTALVAPLLQIEQGAEPLLERLDPPRRAAVLMAILALVLTGIVLVACVMIGGRWVRRLGGGSRRTPTDKPTREPWRDVLREALPDAKTSETLHTHKASDETRAD